MEALVVHTHVPKTGGTALRQLVNANYRPNERVNLDRLEIGGASLLAERDPWAGAVREWRNYWEALGGERRAAIRCVDGHQAPFVLAAVRDRPVRAFCMLREPVDRTVSGYRWMGRRIEAGAPAGAQALMAMRERGWSVKDVYRKLGEAEALSPELHRAFWPFFNGQARHLLLGTVRPSDVPFAAGVDALAGCRERVFSLLSDSYVVGVQNRFSQSVRLFADSLGWGTVFVPRANVSPRAASGFELDDETIALIRDYNALDAELHAHYSQRLEDQQATGRLTELRGRTRRGVGRLRARLASRG